MTLAKINHGLDGMTPVVARIKTTNRKVKTSIAHIKYSSAVRTYTLTVITKNSIHSCKFSSQNKAVIKI